MEWEIYESQSACRVPQRAAGLWSMHIALRRFVKGRMMGDALLYSVPENQMQAMTKRMKDTDAQAQKAVAVKKEYEAKWALLVHSVAPDNDYMKIDLTEAAPLVAEPRPEKEALIMKSMVWPRRLTSSSPLQ